MQEKTRPAFGREVNIKLQPEDLASVRFALSPLWECIAAFRAWMNPQPHALLLPWIARVDPVLRNADWSLLSDLALVSRGTIPDFLCPPPITPMPTIAEELDTVMSAPCEVVRTEIKIACGNRAVPMSLRCAMRSLPSFMKQLRTQIEEFWQTAVAPYWAVLRARLEGEMLYRARVLALGGFEELFSGLHRDVSFRDDHLVVRTDSHWDGSDRKRGLLLVPSIFSWPDVFLTVRPPWRTAIMYPSRGIADMWHDRSCSSSTGLGQLLGHSCAKIIARLRVPQTTLETAAALGLSPAATSEQITKLWSVGILERTRIGRRVFYSLNQKGMTLFTTFRA